MSSQAEIDEAILSVVTTRWQKVSMVIVRALGKRHHQAHDSVYQEIGARIEALIAEGKVQCQGNPKRWRHSEVRIP